VTAPVYIAGVGMTPFGRLTHLSVKDLTRMAVDAALADAGASLGDVEAAWFSNVRQGQMQGQNSIRGQCALRAMGVGGIPIANVENACASSTTGLLQAAATIRAGMADLVLVVGAEKMVFPDRKAEMFAAFKGGTDVHEMEATHARLVALGREVVPSGVPEPDPSQRSFFMDIYAALARLHMSRFGTTPRQIAAAAAKNHAHSVHNPLSQYRTAMDIEAVLADAPVLWPLTRAMCAPMSVGSAALVVCSEKARARLAALRAVRLRGIRLVSGTDREPGDYDRQTGRLAALAAYDEAGLGPADIDVAEVHDATSFGEILQVENLGLVARGEGGPAAERGDTALGGRIPVNPSGGLVSKGHPIAATGAGMVHEIVCQLRGEAGPRQVAGARAGIIENGGGFVGVEEAATVVAILTRD
jgi:acetyl-CoA acetyltransferase